MSTGSFRLQSKDLFLTYPQCNARPSDVYAHLRTVLKDLACAAICSERHESGDPHLHAIVQLTKRCNLHSPNCLDIPDGQGGVFHGNYQPVRSKRACLNYVEKDGCVEYFDTTVEACRAYYGGSTGGKRKLGEAFEELRNGTSMADLLVDPTYQGATIMHQEKLMKALATVRLQESLKKKKKFQNATPADGTIGALRIASWLNENIGKERVFAQTQLYVHGPTKHGKTTLTNMLDQCLRIYWMPTEDWYDFYDDDLYDLVVIDEFKAQKTIQFMNQFLDGSCMPIKQRYHSTVKRKNLPVLILSNYSLRECYTKVDDSKLETLERRLVVVDLDQPFRLDINTVDVE